MTSGHAIHIEGVITNEYDREAADKLGRHRFKSCTNAADVWSVFLRLSYCYDSLTAAGSASWLPFSVAPFLPTTKWTGAGSRARRQSPSRSSPDLRRRRHFGVHHCYRYARKKSVPAYPKGETPCRDTTVVLYWNRQGDIAASAVSRMQQQ